MISDSITKLFNVTYQIRDDAENPCVGFNREQVKEQCKKITEVLYNESVTTLDSSTVTALQDDLSYLYRLQSYIPGTYEHKTGMTVKYSNYGDGTLSVQVSNVE